MSTFWLVFIRGGQAREEEPQQPAAKKSYFTGSGMTIEEWFIDDSNDIMELRGF